MIAYELLNGEKPSNFPPPLGGMISDDVPPKLEQCAGLPEFRICSGIPGKNEI